MSRCFLFGSLFLAAFALACGDGTDTTSSNGGQNAGGENAGGSGGANTGGMATGGANTGGMGTGGSNTGGTSEICAAGECSAPASPGDCPSARPQNGTPCTGLSECYYCDVAGQYARYACQPSGTWLNTAGGSC